MMQWLRFHTSTVGGMGSIPVQGTKILQATWHATYTHTHTHMCVCVCVCVYKNLVFAAKEILCLYLFDNSPLHDLLVTIASHDFDLFPCQFFP